MGPIYVTNSDILPERHAALELCKAVEHIAKDTIDGAFAINNNYLLYMKTSEARQALLQKGLIQIDGRKIELSAEHPSYLFKIHTQMVYI